MHRSTITTHQHVLSDSVSTQYWCSIGRVLAQYTTHSQPIETDVVSVVSQWTTGGDDCDDVSNRRSNAADEHTIFIQPSVVAAFHCSCTAAAASLEEPGVLSQRHLLHVGYKRVLFGFSGTGLWYNTIIYVTCTLRSQIPAVDKITCIVNICRAQLWIYIHVHVHT